MTAEGAWRRAQRQLATRPHLPVVAWIGLAGLLGVASGGLVPESMTDVLPLWLAQTWSVAIAAGGVLAVPGCLLDSSRTESIGLGLIVYGVLFYAVVVGVFSWPASFTVVALCAAIASMCVIRMRVLSLSRRAESRALGGQDGY